MSIFWLLIWFNCILVWKHTSYHFETSKFVKVCFIARNVVCCGEYSIWAWEENIFNCWMKYPIMSIRSHRLTVLFKSFIPLWFSACLICQLLTQGNETWTMFWNLKQNHPQHYISKFSPPQMSFHELWSQVSLNSDYSGFPGIRDMKKISQTTTCGGERESGLDWVIWFQRVY